MKSQTWGSENSKKKKPGAGHIELVNIFDCHEDFLGAVEDEGRL